MIDGAYITQMQYQHDGGVRMFCPLSDDKFIFLHEITLASMLHLGKQFIPQDHSHCYG